MEGQPAISARIDAAEQGDRLKAARILRRQTGRKAFAKASGVPNNALRDYEQGIRGITGRDRIALAEALELPQRWFTDPLEELVAERPEASLTARLDQLSEQVGGLENRLQVLLLDALGRLLDDLSQLIEGQTGEQGKPAKENGPRGAAGNPR